MRPTFLVVSLLTSAALAGAALAGPAGKTSPAPAKPIAESTAKPEIGSFGFDEAGMDRTVKPGDDFFRFAGGGWFTKTEIPADRAAFGMFNVLQERSLTQTRAILDEASAQPGSKIGDFYASFMDQATIDQRGITPLAPWMARLKGATSREALLVEMAKLQRHGVGGLIGLFVNQDEKAPDHYIVSVSQGGIALPNRDYYLKDDPKLAAVRTAYQANSAKMLALIGEGENAEARAQAVFAFEKALAEAHWTAIQSRDSDATYNKWSAADFDAKAPGMPWGALRTAFGVAGESEFIVAQPSAITGEAKVVGATPVEVLRDYAMLRTVRSYAAYLAKPIDDTNFAFYGPVLSGQAVQRDRWKRGVAIVSGAMGEEIGKVYVARYFPPATKAAADTLVKNVIAAMGARIDKLSWMTPATKAKARSRQA